METQGRFIEIGRGVEIPWKCVEIQRRFVEIQWRFVEIESLCPSISMNLHESLSVSRNSIQLNKLRLSDVAPKYH